MKRIIMFVLGATLAFSAAAQTWQDALLFSENNYSGTARGVGMGNALTAIGGDAGSLIFNPAGSATASYSQFMITPGITFSFTNTQASADNLEAYKGESVGNTFARMKLPNIGIVLNMETGRRSGLRRMSFGFVVNSTNNFTGRFKTAGVNGDNSYAASLASSADGYAENVMANENWYFSGDPTRMPAWVDMTGYRSGMFNGVSGRDGAYVALTEIIDEDGNFRLAAPVYQQYGQQSYGAKTDAILNFAMDFSDRLYVGANLGITALRYNLSEFWSEMPENPADFPTIRYSDGTTAQFESLRMNRKYRLNGNGLYLKVGALWRPVDGLRVAAAVQTPTILNLTERYGYSGEVTMSGKFQSSASSPEDEWIYALVSPFRANVGVAYTFGGKAVLSADYEFVHYGQARFKSRTSDYEYSVGNFSDVNLDIKDLLGPSHQLRVGAEFKINSDFSLRTGYNLTTGAQRNYLDGNIAVPLSSEARLAQLKHSVSAGVGYSFGSLFIDAAVRARFVPVDYVIPYNYYYAPNASQFYNKVVDDAILTPEIMVKSTLVDALVTLGWRF
ncbi:MAG: hypothetical protein J5646_00030 [Bacteroidales bacterium]|nr:hypothetical protein [Bacteroidales bacterium]